MGKLKKTFKKLIKAVPAVVGIVGGTAVGGPAGAMVGGALGHGVTKGGSNKLTGAMKGAGMGALYSSIAPSAYSAFGGTPGAKGFFPSITGINHPSLLHQLGFKSAPGMGGGLGLYGNLGNKGLLEKGMFEKGLLADIPGGDFLKSHLANAFSQSRGKQQPFYQDAGTGYDPYGYGESVISHAQPEPIPMMERGETQQDLQKKQRIDHIMKDRSSSPVEKLMQLLQMLEGDSAGSHSAAQARNITHRDISPQKIIASFKGMREGGQVFGRGSREKYAKGGYIRGHSGGQADDVPIGLKPGSFVMDATTVSLYGDGNSENGAKKLQRDLMKMRGASMKRALMGTPTRNVDVRPIRAKVSPGEMIIDKEHVDRIGGGDNRLGSDILDKFRNNLRKHKGVTHFLPKKSKSFNAYLRGN